MIIYRMKIRCTRSLQKGNFSLAQVPSTLQSKMQEVQAGDVQIETFRQAEEKRALVQAVTKGDLTDVNKRLQEMEVRTAL